MTILPTIPCHSFSSLPSQTDSALHEVVAEISRSVERRPTDQRLKDLGWLTGAQRAQQPPVSKHDALLREDATKKDCLAYPRRQLPGNQIPLRNMDIIEFY